MDKLNEQWLGGKLIFYFRYKRRLLESMVEGTCLNIGCGSHVIEGAVNVDEGLPSLPYPDSSFDTVICSDVLEHLGQHKQAIGELLRVARKKVIITVPAYRWLYGDYDRLIGHKRRYQANDFSGFQITKLFWFLLPILFARKIFNLRHRQLPLFLDNIFFHLSKVHFAFGTTILAVKYKVDRSAHKNYRVAIFIPVFNEEKIIERDIKTLDYMLQKIPLDYEIFIVNDASKDKTEDVAKKITEGNKKVSLLQYDLGPTRRENLSQSFTRTTADIIAFVDIDLVSSLRFLSDLIDEVIKGHDIVIGSRYVPGAKIKRKPSRLFMSIIYNAIIRRMFGTEIHDHMCGFKAFRREAALKLIEEMGYDKTLQRGVFWDTELLVRAKRHGFTVKEIPIWWRERNKSALYFGREVKAIPYICKFWLRFFFGTGKQKTQE